MEEENEMVVKRLSVPLGLEELMESLTKEVLRKKPDDIYTFASDHFSQLLSIRDQANYSNSLRRKISRSISQTPNGSFEHVYHRKAEALKIKSATTCTVARINKAVPAQKSQKSPAQKLSTQNLSTQNLSAQNLSPQRSSTQKLPTQKPLLNKRSITSKIDTNLSPRTMEKNNANKTARTDKTKMILERRRSNRSISNGSNGSTPRRGSVRQPVELESKKITEVRRSRKEQVQRQATTRKVDEKSGRTRSSSKGSGNGDSVESKGKKVLPKTKASPRAGLLDKEGRDGLLISKIATAVGDSSNRNDRQDKKDRGKDHGVGGIQFKERSLEKTQNNDEKSSPIESREVNIETNVQDGAKTEEKTENNVPKSSPRQLEGADSEESKDDSAKHSQIQSEEIDLESKVGDIESKDRILESEGKDLESKERDFESKEVDFEIAQENTAKSSPIETKSVDLESQHGNHEKPVDNDEKCPSVQPDDVNLETKEGILRETEDNGESSPRQSKEIDLEPKEVDLESKERDLESKYTDLESKGNDLESKDTVLESKEVDLASKDTDLEAKATDLESKGSDLESKNPDLESKEVDLASKDTDLESQGSDLESKGTDLESKVDLQSKDTDLEAKGTDLDSKGRNLESEGKDLESKERDFESKEVDLETAKDNTSTSSPIESKHGNHQKTVDNDEAFSSLQSNDTNVAPKEGIPTETEDNGEKSSPRQLQEEDSKKEESKEVESKQEDSKEENLGKTGDITEKPSPMSLEKAAVLIQSLVRGFLSRRRLQTVNTTKEAQSNPTQPSNQKYNDLIAFLDNEHVFYQSERFDQQPEAMNKQYLDVRTIEEPNMTSPFGKHVSPSHQVSEALSDKPNYLEEAATTIQSAWRGHRTRRSIIAIENLQKPQICDELPHQRLSPQDAQKAATVIQALFRGYMTRKHTTITKYKPTFQETLPTLLEADESKSKRESLSEFGEDSNQPEEDHMEKLLQKLESVQVPDQDPFDDVKVLVRTDTVEELPCIRKSVTPLVDGDDGLEGDGDLLLTEKDSMTSLEGHIKDGIEGIKEDVQKLKETLEDGVVQKIDNTTKDIVDEVDTGVDGLARSISHDVKRLEETLTQDLVTNTAKIDHEDLVRPVSKDSTTSNDSVKTVIFNDNIMEHTFDDVAKTLDDDIAKTLDDDIAKALNDDVAKALDDDVAKALNDDVAKVLDKTNKKITESDLQAVKDQSGVIVSDVLNAAATKIQHFFKDIRKKSTESVTKPLVRGKTIVEDLPPQSIDDSSSYSPNDSVETNKEVEVDKQITQYLKTITEPIRRAFSADKPLDAEKKTVLRERSQSAKAESPEYIYIPLRQYTVEETVEDGGVDGKLDEEVPKHEKKQENVEEQVISRKAIEENAEALVKVVVEGDQQKNKDALGVKSPKEDYGTKEISEYIDSIVNPIKKTFSPNKMTEIIKEPTLEDQNNEPEYQYIPLRDYSVEDPLVGDEKRLDDSDNITEMKKITEVREVPEVRSESSNTLEVPIQNLSSPPDFFRDERSHRVRRRSVSKQESIAEEEAGAEDSAKQTQSGVLEDGRLKDGSVVGGKNEIEDLSDARNVVDGRSIVQDVAKMMTIEEDVPMSFLDGESKGDEVDRNKRDRGVALSKEDLEEDGLSSNKDGLSNKEEINKKPFRETDKMLDEEDQAKGNHEVAKGDHEVAKGDHEVSKEDLQKECLSNKEEHNDMFFLRNDLKQGEVDQAKTDVEVSKEDLPEDDMSNKEENNRKLFLGNDEKEHGVHQAKEEQEEALANEDLGKDGLSNKIENYEVSFRENDNKQDEADQSNRDIEVALAKENLQKDSLTNKEEHSEMSFSEKDNKQEKVDQTKGDIETALSKEDLREDGYSNEEENNEQFFRGNDKKQDEVVGAKRDIEAASAKEDLQKDGLTNSEEHNDMSFPENDIKQDEVDQTKGDTETALSKEDFQKDRYSKKEEKNEQFFRDNDNKQDEVVQAKRDTEVASANEEIHKDSCTNKGEHNESFPEKDNKQDEVDQTKGDIETALSKEFQKDGYSNKGENNEQFFRENDKKQHEVVRAKRDIEAASAKEDLQKDGLTNREEHNDMSFPENDIKQDEAEQTKGDTETALSKEDFQKDRYSKKEENNEQFFRDNDNKQDEVVQAKRDNEVASANEELHKDSCTNKGEHNESFPEKDNKQDEVDQTKGDIETALCKEFQKDGYSNKGENNEQFFRENDKKQDEVVRAKRDIEAASAKEDLQKDGLTNREEHNDMSFPENDIKQDEAEQTKGDTETALSKEDFQKDRYSKKEENNEQFFRDNDNKQDEVVQAKRDNEVASANEEIHKDSCTNKGEHNESFPEKDNKQDEVDQTKEDIETALSKEDLQKDGYSNKGEKNEQFFRENDKKQDEVVQAKRDIEVASAKEDLQEDSLLNKEENNKKSFREKDEKQDEVDQRDHAVSSPKADLQRDDLLNKEQNFQNPFLENDTKQDKLDRTKRDIEVAVPKENLQKDVFSNEEENEMFLRGSNGPQDEVDTKVKEQTFHSDKTAASSMEDLDKGGLSNKDNHEVDLNSQESVTNTETKTMALQENAEDITLIPIDTNHDKEDLSTRETKDIVASVVQELKSDEIPLATSNKNKEELERGKDDIKDKEQNVNSDKIVSSSKEDLPKDGLLDKEEHEVDIDNYDSATKSETRTMPQQENAKDLPSTTIDMNQGKQYLSIDESKDTEASVVQELKNNEVSFAASSENKEELDQDKGDINDRKRNVNSDEIVASSKEDLPKDGLLNKVEHEVDINNRESVTNTDTKTMALQENAKNISSTTIDTNKNKEDLSMDKTKPTEASVPPELKNNEVSLAASSKNNEEVDQDKYGIKDKEQNVNSDKIVASSKEDLPKDGLLNKEKHEADTNNHESVTNTETSVTNTETKTMALQENATDITSTSIDKNQDKQDLSFDETKDTETSVVQELKNNEVSLAASNKNKEELGQNKDDLKVKEQNVNGNGIVPSSKEDLLNDSLLNKEDHEVDINNHAFVTNTETKTMVLQENVNYITSTPIDKDQDKQDLSIDETKATEASVAQELKDNEDPLAASSKNKEERDQHIDDINDKEQNVNRDKIIASFEEDLSKDGLSNKHEHEIDINNREPVINTETNTLQENAKDTTLTTIDTNQDKQDLSIDQANDAELSVAQEPKNNEGPSGASNKNKEELDQDKDDINDRKRNVNSDEIVASSKDLPKDGLLNKEKHEADTNNHESVTNTETSVTNTETKTIVLQENANDITSTNIDENQYSITSGVIDNNQDKQDLSTDKTKDPEASVVQELKSDDVPLAARNTNKEELDQDKDGIKVNERNVNIHKIVASSKEDLPKDGLSNKENNEIDINNHEPVANTETKTMVLQENAMNITSTSIDKSQDKQDLSIDEAKDTEASFAQELKNSEVPLAASNKNKEVLDQDKDGIKDKEQNVDIKDKEQNGHRDQLVASSKEGLPKDGLLNKEELEVDINNHESVANTGTKTMALQENAMNITSTSIDKSQDKQDLSIDEAKNTEASFAQELKNSEVSLAASNKNKEVLDQDKDGIKDKEQNVDIKDKEQIVHRDQLVASSKEDLPKDALLNKEEHEVDINNHESVANTGTKTMALQENAMNITSTSIDKSQDKEDLSIDEAKNTEASFAQELKNSEVPLAASNKNKEVLDQDKDGIKDKEQNVDIKDKEQNVHRDQLVASSKEDLPKDALLNKEEHEVDINNHESVTNAETKTMALQENATNITSTSIDKSQGKQDLSIDEAKDTEASFAQELKNSEVPLAASNKNKEVLDQDKDGIKDKEQNVDIKDKEQNGHRDELVASSKEDLPKDGLLNKEELEVDINNHESVANTGTKTMALQENAMNITSTSIDKSQNKQDLSIDEAKNTEASFAQELKNSEVPLAASNKNKEVLDQDKDGIKDKEQNVDIKDKEQNVHRDQLVASSKEDLPKDGLLNKEELEVDINNHESVTNAVTKTMALQENAMNITSTSIDKSQDKQDLSIDEAKNTEASFAQELKNSEVLLAASNKNKEVLDQDKDGIKDKEQNVDIKDKEQIVHRDQLVALSKEDLPTDGLLNKEELEVDIDNHESVTNAETKTMALQENAMNITSTSIDKSQDKQDLSIDEAKDTESSFAQELKNSEVPLAASNKNKEVLDQDKDGIKDKEQNVDIKDKEQNVHTDQLVASSKEDLLKDGFLNKEELEVDINNHESVTNAETKTMALQENAMNITSTSIDKSQGKQDLSIDEAKDTEASFAQELKNSEVPLAASNKNKEVLDQDKDSIKDKEQNVDIKDKEQNVHRDQLVASSKEDLPKDGLLNKEELEVDINNHESVTNAETKTMALQENAKDVTSTTIGKSQDKEDLSIDEAKGTEASVVQEFKNNEVPLAASSKNKEEHDQDKDDVKVKEQNVNRDQIVAASKEDLPKDGVLNQDKYEVDINNHEYVTNTETKTMALHENAKHITSTTIIDVSKFALQDKFNGLSQPVIKPIVNGNIQQQQTDQKDSNKNVQTKTNGSQTKSEAEPFYLHQEDLPYKIPATSQEKAYAEILKLSFDSEKHSLQPTTAKKKEIYDSIPVKGNLGSSRSSMDEPKQMTVVSEGIQCNLTEDGQQQEVAVVMQTSNDQDNVIPVAVQMNQTSAGAPFLTSASVCFGSGTDDVHCNSATSTCIDDPTQAHRDAPNRSEDDALRRNDDISYENFTRARSQVGMETQNKRNNSTHVKKTMEQEAATKIQASFRGYQVRKQLKNKLAGDNITSIKRTSRRKSLGRIMDNNKNNTNKNSSDLEEESATKIQAGIRGFLVRRRQQKTKSTPETP